jgi:hypothetical protein
VIKEERSKQNEWKNRCTIEDTLREKQERRNVRKKNERLEKYKDR